MRFGNLVVENFMSIQRAEVNFDKKGLVLVQGVNDDVDSFESNGAGKSTLFSEAPTWVLTGETVRGQKSDKVVNRYTGKNTKVFLQILDDNGDVYDIIRYRKHTEHKNHVYLYKNGVNITGKSDSDTNIMIEDLIQMDYSTFTNSVMFGQGVSKMFATSTDSEQKKILEKMLQIDVYKACQDLAKEGLAKVKDSLESLYKDKEYTEASISNDENMLEDMQEKEANYARITKAEIKELQEELEGYQNSLADLPSIAKLEEEIDEFKALKEKIEDKLSKFKSVEDDRIEVIGQIRTVESNMKDVNKSITKKTNELSDLKEKKNVPKTCRACGQDLPLGDTSHMEKHLEGDIEELEKELDKHEGNLDSFNRRLGEFDELLKGKSPLDSQLDSAKSLIKEVETDIRIRNTQEKDLDKSVVRVKKAIKSKEDALEVTYTDIIESIISNLEGYKKRLFEIIDKITELDKEKEDYEFWVKGFGNTGIKSVLLDSVVPFLNSRANSYLSKLADSSIEVLFNTQTTLASGEKRDKFSVEINNDNGDNDYKGNSNGEKRRIDIAINMALQDLVSSRSNKRIDLIVYDECFEGLDSIGCESVIQLLEDKAEVFGSVFVITHNDNLKQLFTKSVVVSKHNGDTGVVENGYV